MNTTTKKVIKAANTKVSIVLLIALSKPKKLLNTNTYKKILKIKIMFLMKKVKVKIVKCLLKLMMKTKNYKKPQTTLLII